MVGEGISGKPVTPYLVARMKALIVGRSLVANLKLVSSNARLGAQVAVELSK